MRILVVDDDRRIVKTTSDILRLKGYDTVTAYSGEEGIERIRSDTPDCVLMDINMPGISGVESMQRMLEIDPDLPVILVSACPTDEVVEQAKQAGAYAVLSKPLNLQMILSFLALLRKEESILIIDDDLNLSQILQDILTLRGYRVETESHPQQTLGHMKNNYQLVVLLDLKLGTTSGLEVLKQIRERYPTKPVVLITGYGSELADSINRVDDIGAYACLFKPLETDNLLGLIEEVRMKKLKNVLSASM